MRFIQSRSTMIYIHIPVNKSVTTAHHLAFRENWKSTASI